MFNEVNFTPTERPDTRKAKQVLDAFGLPTDVIAVERLRHIMAQGVTFGSDLIQVEAAQFLERVRNTGHRISYDPGAFDTPQLDNDRATPVKPHWVLSYIPRLLPPDEDLLGNVRFENAGSVSMPAEGEGRVAIAVRWLNEDGEVLKVADIRTPLPIDLAPGQALTLPVRFRTPQTEGQYKLVIVLVEEGIRWIEDQKYALQVTIRRPNKAAALNTWTFNPEQMDYDSDHNHGVEILRDWLEHYSPTNPKILEVGGNAVPMIERLDGELHNIDVDLLGLQICSLRQRQMGRAMTILCADAQDLPYQASYFDVIVVFASLHHFPNPARLLASLRTRLKPNGFLAVMCEPVGHVWPGAMLPEFLAELKRGVNEQSFTVDEYSQIFRLAELDAAQVIVDKSSLKARLVPKVA